MKLYMIIEYASNHIFVIRDTLPTYEKNMKSREQDISLSPRPLSISLSLTAC